MEKWCGFIIISKMIEKIKDLSFTGLDDPYFPEGEWYIGGQFELSSHKQIKERE